MAQNNNVEYFDLSLLIKLLKCIIKRELYSLIVSASTLKSTYVKWVTQVAMLHLMETAAPFFCHLPQKRTKSFHKKQVVKLFWPKLTTNSLLGNFCQISNSERVTSLFLFPAIFTIWAENHPLNVNVFLPSICQLKMSECPNVLSLKSFYH